MVVKKNSGGFCICVDLKPPNKNTVREVNPVSHVDDTLTQLVGSIFLKLDTNSGI